MENKVFHEEIIEYISNLVGELLNRKVTEYNTPFIELGLESVNVPTFIKSVSKRFDIKVGMTAIFKYPTINDFSNYVFDRLNSDNAKKNSKEKNINKFTKREEDKVAIVGMSCRFPNGGNSPEEYWDNLIKGKDRVSIIPKDRWDINKYYSEDKKESGKMYTKYANFLNTSIKEFDAQFFNISPKEAESLDPQQRILLELTWEAFENSGMDIREYFGTNTGVYGAIACEEYSMGNYKSGNLDKIDAYSLTGTAFSTAFGRISYTFGFEGPCISVDTACSSTLTALHIACKALEAGEVDTAIVAGVNLMLTPTIHVCFSKLGAISSDGMSKSFDSSANGYGRGEGAGVIILKRKTDAESNKDNILGLVSGTAINQDGKSNGLTAPNGAAQEKVILKALNCAGLKSTDVDYIETHGTGTPLGDPIEINAIANVYCKDRMKENPLKIGSVKSNIGHLEAAAGMASIIKVLLSFQNEEIPANLNFREPNPYFSWSDYPIEVVSSNTRWERGNKVRRVGINGFGFGGSNAHVILEEAPIKLVERSSKKDPEYILKISAKNKKSLLNNVISNLEYISEHKNVDLRDFVYTNNINKSDFNYRFAVYGKNRDELIASMKSYLENKNDSTIVTNVDHNSNVGQEKKLVFLFTGQGSQYLEMGEGLYNNDLVFKNAFDECDKLFKGYLDVSLTELLYSKNYSEEYIERTLYAQPLIFTVEYAISKMWENLGIKPSIVLGHSIGEYAAAVISGILTLKDGVKLVATRSRLMDSAPGEGTMLAIYTNLNVANELIEEYKDRVSIAVHNAENNIVISGDKKAIGEIEEILENRKIKAKRLHVSHAFHSKMMNPILDEFRDVASTVKYDVTKVEFMSSALARLLEKDEVLGAEYWTNHISGKVDFYNALKKIAEDNNVVFLEVGANKTLCSLTKLILGENIPLINSLDMKKDSIEAISNAIANMYCYGFNIRWEKLGFGSSLEYNRVKLPVYEYDKQQYWIEPIYSYDTDNINGEIDYHPLIGERISSPYLQNSVIYQKTFTNESPYFMKEHVIFDAAIAPAAAYMSMLMSIAEDYQHPTSCTIENVEFRTPLIATEDEDRTVQFIINNTNLEKMSFDIVSKEKKSKNENWISHCNGNVTMNQGEKSNKTVDIDKLINMYPEEKDGFSIYDVMKKFGFKLGDGFARIKKSWKGEDCGVFYIEPKTDIPGVSNYTVYAGVIDSILQTIFSLSKLVRGIYDSENYSMQTTIPMTLKKLKYYYRKAEAYWCHVKIDNNQNLGLLGNIEVYNEKGEIVFEIENILAKLTDRDSLLKELNNSGNHMLYNVEWIEKKREDKRYKVVSNEKYVLFANEENVANILYEKLSESGINPIRVIQGDSYQERENGIYSVSYGDKEQIIKLLTRISEDDGKDKIKILYVSTENIDSISNITIDKLIEKETIECSGLLNLVQVIIEENLINRMSIKVITNNVHKVDNEPISIYQSTLWGFSEVIRLEHNKLWDGIIDVDYNMLSGNSDELIKEITNGEDNQVVLRSNGERYVSRLYKGLKKLNEKPELNITINEDSTYIITGGTGSIGTIYTEELIEKGAKNIIWLNRSEPKGNALDNICKWKEKGVNILVEKIDVSNNSEVKKFIDRVKESGMNIKGVVHTAGILEDMMIKDQSWSTFESLFKAKVWGTYNLHEALVNDKLDFFIMMSSITSIVGNVGQANYAAANYFMNSFAEYRRSLGMPAMSICWGPWAGDGMATQSENTIKNISAKGIYSMSKELGKKMINKLFNKDISTIVVVDANWQLYSEKTAVDEVTEFLSEFITTNKQSVDNEENNKENLLDKLRELKFRERSEYLQNTLQKVAARIMGFNDISNLSLDKPLTEQGADSLMIFSIRSEIKNLLNSDIDVSTFYNYPSIRKLSEYLLIEVIESSEKVEEEIAVTKINELDSVDDILSEINELIK